MEVPRLEAWSTTAFDPRLPTREPGNLCVQGNVYGREGFADGDHILTMPVTSFQGRTIVTKSGSTYLLGEPDPEFVAFLAEEGRPFDPENPIRFVPKETSP